MDYKNKVFVIALFILLIFSLGAVSAQEDMTYCNSEENSIETLVESTGEENKLTITDNSISKTNHNVSGNTFADIQRVIDNANPGDTIFLNENTYIGKGEQINITKNNITIIGGFTIDDGKYATLDAKGQSRMFYITGSNVMLQGIIFTNGYAIDHGGAIYKGIAKNCTFINNTAEKTGGAIIQGFAENCRFINNAAYIGGAICQTPAENCTFIRNTAETGGAMIIYYAMNCIFINNSAERNGGAMSWADATNCTFINNTAKEFGGAIWYWLSGSTVINSYFENNSAHEGGAIHSTYCRLNIIGSTFSNNWVVNKLEIGAEILVEDFDCVAVDFNAGERGDYLYAILIDKYGNVLANKTVQIAVNGMIYNVTTDEDGFALLKINLASANTYTYALFFQGDEQYDASLLASSKLTVTKKPMYITASNHVFKATAKTKTITVKLTTIKNPYDNKMYLNKGKKVTLTINGKTYTASSNDKGIVKFNIAGLSKKGTYTAIIKFAGDRTYKAISKTIKVTLNDKGSTTINGVKSETSLMAKSGNTVKADSSSKTGNIMNGKKNAIIIVDKEFTHTAIDYNAGERGIHIYATLKDTDGNPLANKTMQIAVNGMIYKVKTDIEGRAGIMINLASANTYTYALAFSGDSEYNAAPLACSKLVLTKKPITISAKDQTSTASAKTKTVSAKLQTIKNPYDGKTYIKAGKKVTLKIDGKTFTSSIDSKGNVKFNIGSLTKKGTYSAVISFAGDQGYNSSTKTIKITLK